jgi:hypothetical protein
MADITHKTVIFLTLANDRDDTVGYLRNLTEEARQIREPLQRARRDGLCALVELANTTADDIFRVIQDPEYRDRIAVFHYGGHANGCHGFGGLGKPSYNGIKTISEQPRAGLLGQEIQATVSRFPPRD